MSNLWPYQRDAMSFYGDPRNKSWFANNVVRIVPPFPMTYEGQPVKTLSVHKKCAESLMRVLNNISAQYSKKYGKDMLQHLIADGVTKYSGIYNPRNIAGSSNLSMHAFAAAIDLDAGNNGFTYDRRAGKFKSESIIVQAFKAEGWRWGGDYLRRRDPMHFEAIK